MSARSLFERFGSLARPPAGNAFGNASETNASETNASETSASETNASETSATERTLARGTMALTGGVLLVGLASLFGATPAQTAASAGTRGASLGLFATDPNYDYADMLAEIRSRGASDVLIVYRLMQDDVHASSMRRVDGDSPSGATLERTLGQAQRLGLRVGIMPIIGLTRRERGDWRGTLAPTEGASAWFGSYERHVMEAAHLAERHGAARLFLGSELNSMEPHGERWRTMASKVRDVFGGTLSYSANWDRYEGVPFWEALDEIAVSAYFRVGNRDEPSILQVERVWSARLSELNRFARARSMPLSISEVGYPAHSEAAAVPWDETRDARVDVALQASLLAAFCRQYEQRPGAGYYVWNWFGYGGPRDRGYSPRGKPAAAEFQRCMQGTRG